MRRDYYPFGESVTASGDEESLYQFTGKEKDSNTGLIYFGARYYDPGIGRWIIADPAINNFDIDLIEKYNLFSISPYCYARNNPIIRIDENGYIDKRKVIAGGISIVGGVTEGLFGIGVSTATGVTGIGLVGGAVATVHGFSVASFGLGMFLAGLTDADVKVPSGPAHAFGMGLEKDLGLKGASEVGELADATISLTSGQSPFKSIRNITKSIPLSAREAVVLNSNFKTITLKEGIQQALAAKSASEVIQSSNQIQNIINSFKHQTNDVNNFEEDEDKE
ncbi:hypothetical protein GF354_03470 [Candidatus Peregrinibacteria bacterium]|nr:hypothetical protein [Candidatus Peregrinibacteria bacterium]